MLLAATIGLLGVLYGLSLALQPASEGPPDAVTIALIAVTLMLHSALYAFGARVRASFGTVSYLAAHALTLLALGALHPPLLLILSLYAALTAHAVMQLEGRLGAMPVFLAAVAVIAVSTGVTSGLYRGVTIAAIIAAGGLAVYGVSVVLRRTQVTAQPAALGPVVTVTADGDLTARELEVLRLAASGKRSKEIASALAISERTVKAHLAHAYQKLGVESRAEAVAVASRRGLL